MTDQPCLEVPFDEVEKWEKIQGSCARLYAAANWGYKQALATPLLEPPTDEEIADWHGQCADLTRLREADHYWAFDLRSDEVAGVVRAALARWGRPATPPPELLTDEEIQEWADACSEAPLEEMDPDVHGWRRCFTAKEFSETIRAALERWGN